MNIDIFIQFAQLGSKWGYAYELQHEGRVIHRNSALFKTAKDQGSVRTRQYFYAMTEIVKVLKTFSPDSIHFYTADDKVVSFVDHCAVLSKHRYIGYGGSSLRFIYEYFKQIEVASTLLPVYGGALKRVDEEANRVLSTQNLLTATAV